MRIKLITPEEHAELIRIQAEHPNLTYQAKGYDTPDRSKWSEEYFVAHKNVSDILSKSVVGFHSFTNFTVRKCGGMGIRFQYNYGAEYNTMPFTGVGYLLIDELLNGFTNDELSDSEANA
jgi:hypothetical protein